MEKIVAKLTQGEPLSVDQLIEYLPALKEVARAQLDNWAKGAAVLRRYKKGQIVCREGEFGSTAYFIVSGTVDILIAAFDAVDVVRIPISDFNSMLEKFPGVRARLEPIALFKRAGSSLGRARTRTTH